MIFSSINFVCFFLIVIVSMAITNIRFLENKIDTSLLRKWLLLIFSFVFYAWWDWRFCGLMLIVIGITYAVNVGMTLHPENRKYYLRAGIICELVILAFFKYFNFFLDTFKAVFNMQNRLALNIILPIGISFYTFQAISFMLDVYRGQVKKSGFLNTALYISFFPQLVAGPIVKAKDFLPQLEENRRISFKNLETGIQIFVIGLLKKIVIADHLSVFVDDVYGKPLAFDSLTVLLAVIAYSIQIYCDFSGYSDMAIGCAKCLGYDLNRNFNLPYAAMNVSEFWKRWHISLSSWLMEYLYFPLGGNRKGECRRYVNILVTMILGGLWHGANWNFVLWGTLHGVMLCIHKFWLKIRQNKSAADWTAIPCGILTYLWVSFCWVFFRNENITNAFVILKRIFFWSNDGIRQIFFWLIVAIIFMLSMMAHARKHAKGKLLEEHYIILDLSKTIPLFIWFVVLGAILGTAYTGDNPFIYFQF